MTDEERGMLDAGRDPLDLLGHTLATAQGNQAARKRK
jgi:hypothetical protein